MRHIPKVLALGVLLLALVPALSAQKAAEKPLTDKEVVKMIADWPVIAKWFEDRGKQMGQSADGGFSSGLFLDKDFKAFIAKRGWTVERFSYVAGTSFSLLMVVGMEKQNPETAKQFDEAIAQIQASEDMSAAQKAESIKAINEAKASMLAVSSDKEINQAELAIVRARYDDLMKLAEFMGEE